MKVILSEQLQDFNKSIGISLDSILERARLPNILWKEELELSPEEYYRFLVEMDKVLTDEQVLALSSIENTASFMPPLYVALCAGNARNAFQRFAKYKRLIGPLVIELSEVADAIELRMRFDIPDAVMPRFSELSEQLILVSMIRAGTGKHIVPARVRTRYEYGDAITEYLGVLPEKAEENMIAFRVADCELPFITQNNASDKGFVTPAAGIHYRNLRRGWECKRHECGMGRPGGPEPDFHQPLAT